MSFSDDLREIANKTGRKLEEVAYRTFVNIFSGVVIVSPVDTGLFKGNWQISIGAPADGTLDRKDPSGALVLQEIQDKMPKELGQVVYLANNLPYAYRLEYEDWSPQAPGGMVRVTVARFEQEVRRQAREAR